MSDIYQSLDPGLALIRAADTNKPSYKEIQGTNLVIPCLSFPDADTQAFFVLDLKLWGASETTLDIELEWGPDTSTTTTHTVVWGFALAAYTPETDTTDPSAKSFATEQTVSDDVLGTTAKRMQRTTLALTNIDSAATGDYAVLRVRRVASNASDDLTGAALWYGGRVKFQDT